MNYAQIRRFDVANGPGIRTTLFVSGCTFHCPECFNEEYQDYNFGELFDQKVKDTILEYLKDDCISGLSILGGEPLTRNKEDLNELYDFILQVKEAVPEKTIWLWSGWTWEEIFPRIKVQELSVDMLYRQSIVCAVDVLVDGLFQKEKKDIRLTFRGSSNQRLIDVKKTIASKEICKWKR